MAKYKKGEKTEQDNIIADKQDFATMLIAIHDPENIEKLSQINDQIEICEQLGKPITKKQISEWVHLSINSMLRKVHTHKFA